MAQDLLTAFALVLVIEGLLPTLAPRAWLQALREVSGFSARAVRIGGILSLVAGAMLFRLVQA